MGKALKYSPAVLVLALLTVGVVWQSVPLIYAGIISVCVAIILVAFNVLKSPQYPYLLFAIALGMVFQFMLAGSNLVGPDVHLEYYWAQYYSGGDVWPPLRFYCPAAGLGAIFVAPALQKVLLIPNIYTFKVVFPILFAFVPVVLYHLFVRWMDERKAFIATFVFVAFPCFLLEMPGIPESMLAELFMVLAIYHVIVDKYRLRYRIPLIIICGLCTSFVHYSMGFITIIFMGVAFLTKIILRVRGGIPHKAMAGICLVVTAGSLLFFSVVADGAVMVKVSRLWNGWFPAPFQITYWHYPEVEENAPQPLESPAPLNVPGKSTDPTSSPEDIDTTGLTADESATEIVEMVIETASEKITLDASTGEVIRTEAKVQDTRPWFQRYHDLMKTALGLDFMKAGVLGKAFRIMLWVIGVCMLVGLYSFRKNKEFWIFATGAVILALACLYSRISPILNASRFAHFALIILVAVFSIGGQRIFRKVGLLALCVVVPYFLFTSGLVFEITKSEASSITIPYSVGLSNQRLDFGASVTDDDREVIQWIAKHKEPGEDVPFPLFADTIGTSSLCEVIGYRPDLMRAFYKYPNLMPKPPYYVFIRERNIKDGVVVIYTGIGQRDYYPFERFGFDVDKNIVYQVGDARVIYVEGADD